MLTRCAMQLLPKHERSLFGNELESLCAHYCGYPDLYYGDAEKIAPYLCFVDGIPFHYIPNEPVEYNNWKVETVNGKTRLAALPLSENVHHRHCRTAFAHYFQRSALAIAENRPADAARFVGAIFHVLEDNTTPSHVIEGFDGADIFVLDRFVKPPANQPHSVPSMLLGGKDVDPGAQAYRPQLLGASPEEAAFHLYSRFADTVIANRFHALPILQAIGAKNETEEDANWKEIYGRTIRLLADFLHTAVALGLKNFAAEELSALQEISLTRVRAARRPRHLSPPYRFTPFLEGCSLDKQRQPVPLQLQFDDGVRHKYRDGFGMGAHAEFAFEYQLPPRVFDRLQGAVGLHPDLGNAGHVKLQWLLDGKVLWEREFRGNQLADHFDLDMSPGGWLVLRGQALTDRWLAPENNLVLAEPVLVRSPSASVGL